VVAGNPHSSDTHPVGTTARGSLRRPLPCLAHVEIDFRCTSIQRSLTCSTKLGATGPRRCATDVGACDAASCAKLPSWPLQCAARIEALVTVIYASGILDWLWLPAGARRLPWSGRAGPESELHQPGRHWTKVQLPATPAWIKQGATASLNSRSTWASRTPRLARTFEGLCRGANWRSVAHEPQFDSDRPCCRRNGSARRRRAGGGARRSVSSR